MWLSFARTLSIGWKTMKRLLQFCVILVALGLLPAVAQSDQVQIGTISVTPNAVFPTMADINVTSDMSDTSLILEGYSDIGGTVYLGEQPVSPGETLYYLEAAPDGQQMALYGQLGMLDFTVGGQTYEAASLGWTSPTISVLIGAEAPIDITATPLTATPEPSSVLLLAGVGLVLVVRKLIA
jgi:hypothetical protein